MASLEEVNKVMAFLAALWPRDKVTPATIKAYSMILADVPGGAMTAAVESLVSEASPFFPKAGQIKQRALTLIKEGRLALSPADAQARLVAGHYSDDEMYEWEVERGWVSETSGFIPTLTAEDEALGLAFIEATL